MYPILDSSTATYSNFTHGYYLKPKFTTDYNVVLPPLADRIQAFWPAEVMPLQAYRIRDPASKVATKQEIVDYVGDEPTITVVVDEPRYKITIQAVWKITFAGWAIDVGNFDVEWQLMGNLMRYLGPHLTDNFTLELAVPPTWKLIYQRFVPRVVETSSLRSWYCAMILQNFDVSGNLTITATLQTDITTIPKTKVDLISNLTASRTMQAMYFEGRSPVDVTLCTPTDEPVVHKVSQPVVLDKQQVVSVHDDDWVHL